MESKSFEETVIVKIRETVHLLKQEWSEINLSERQRDERKSAFLKGISDICDSIINNERSMKERVLNRIEVNKLEIFRLCEVMNLTCNEPEDLCMLEMDKFLQNQLSELQIEKECRIREIKELSEKARVICKYLEETPNKVPQDLIPRMEDIEFMRNRLQELEEEKRSRIESYQCFRNDIVQFVEKLERPTEDKFLLDVCSTNEPEASLTKPFLSDVRTLHTALEFETKELESQSLELRERIDHVWHLLQIGQEAKDNFLVTVPNHTPSCITKLEQHLAELNARKLQDIGRYIDDLRNELEIWWSKCYVGEEEKNGFAPYNARTVSEQVLNAYEDAVKRWKEYYKAHSHILQKVDYFLELFDNMQQLEEKLKDPSRLFNTRGGTLLQEEKERRKVKMELPLMQEKLIKLCSEYEANCGRPFLIDGCYIHDYLCKLWQYHNIQRENEKNNRLQTKKNLTTQKGQQNLRKTNVLSGESSRKRGREGDENQEKSSKIPAKAQPSLYKISLHSPYKSKRPFPVSHSSVPQSSKTTKKNLISEPLRQPLVSEENIPHNSTSYDHFKEVLLVGKNIFNSTSISETSAEDQSKTVMTTF